MERTKESKIKTKKHRTSQSSRASSMSSASSHVDEPTRQGSEQEAVAGATVHALSAASPGEKCEERSSSRHSPTHSEQHQHSKAPSLHASLSSSLQQSDQTPQSGAVGSTDSTPASGQITMTLRTTTSSTDGASSADGSPKPCHLLSPAQASDTSSTKCRDSRPVSEASSVLVASEAQQPRKKSAAPQATLVQTDGPPLTGTTGMATRHACVCAMASPAVRRAPTVDTGTDTPRDLWTASGPVPELPFTTAEYTSPAVVIAAKTTAASTKQPLDKKRVATSTANAMSLLGHKSGPATTELGGVASTEATVMLDVNPYVRFPLLVMNLVLWLVGLTLLLVGAYAYVDTWTQSEVPTHKTSYNVYSLFLIKMEISVMLFGMVTMSLSFCGCVGALRENTCLLSVYSSFITALLIINLAGCLIVFFLPSQIKKLLSETFSMELIVHYRDSPDFQRLMDNIQESMQCCGISRSNFRDWNENMYFNCSRSNPSNERCSVPYSCCKRKSTDQVVSLSCGRNVLNMTDYDAWFQVYTGNCLDSAHRYVRDNVTIITGICLVFVILLAFVQMVTQALIDEVVIIRRIYDKFYERAYDLRAAQEPTEPSAN